MVAGVSVVARARMRSIVAKGGRFIAAGDVLEQAVVVDDFAEIAPIHVNEDALFLQVMAYILARGCMQLSIDKVGDMLPIAIKEKLHGPLSTCSTTLAEIANSYRQFVQ